jgi:WD40 repeat protein
MLQEFDGALDCISLAVTCAFNKRGTLLAVGCNDGRIVIWDFLTRGIAKIISAHVHPVCSLRLVLCFAADSLHDISISLELCYNFGCISHCIYL